MDEDPKENIVTAQDSVLGPLLLNAMFVFSIPSVCFVDSLAVVVAAKHRDGDSDSGEDLVE